MAFVLLFFVLLLNMGCRNGPEVASGHSLRPIPVTVGSVVSKPMPIQIFAVGSVEEFAVVSIVPQVGGRIEKVHFKEGQYIKKDDLLFSLDRRPFQAALREAVARRDRDQVLATNAKNDLQRYQSLMAKDFVSREQFDKVQTQAEAAEATLRADQSAVESATLNLQYATIRSPIDGRTGNLLVNQGNVVKANDKPLVIIRQVQPIYVRFAIPEQYLPRIRERMAEVNPIVVATPRGSDEKPIHGELTFVDNTVDTSTGTILLKAQFMNQDETLWPGQYVDVVLELSVESDAVVAPASAIQKSRDGEVVFVLGNDNTVKLRTVKVLVSTIDEVVIEKGLKVGETVVTDGQFQLVDGAKVEIKRNRSHTQKTSTTTKTDKQSSSSTKATSSQP